MIKASAIIQARINSTRLPGKILKTIFDNLNSLDLIHIRLSKCLNLDKIVFAVPDTDLKLIKYLKNKNYEFYTGSEKDVRDRYLKTAEFYSIEKIVRITSDCPLIDPTLVDKCISESEKYEYVSNNTPPAISDYANGSDIEVFSKSLLSSSSKVFLGKKDKEHVTFPFWDGRMNINKFRLTKKSSDKEIRITLDYEEDLIVLRDLLSSSNDIYINYDDIVSKYKLLELGKINGNFQYDAGWK